MPHTDTMAECDEQMRVVLARGLLRGKGNLEAKVLDVSGAGSFDSQ